jgi:hypothetical protein
MDNKMTSMLMEELDATVFHAARVRLRRIKKSCFTLANCKKYMMISKTKLDIGP